jgi:hypothetical protein
MKKAWLLLSLAVLLVACSPSNAADSTTVRILADDTPMFRGDQTIVYDEVETLLAIDTQCVELEVGSFGVQGVPVDLGLLECDEYTGWVHLQHYRYE